MKQGFTLIELSIVLIVIGLIVGGITLGNNMIRNAELKSVTKEFANYQTSLHTFRLKYNAFPGDMENATDYWPTAAGNGNDNGEIDYSTAPTEGMLTWNHLALSEIISGSYPGTQVHTNAVIVGTDVPASSLSGAGFGIRSGSGYGNTDRTYLEFGSPRTSGLYQMSGTALTPQEAYSIDLKVDDGVANTGKVEGYGRHDTNTCTGSIYNAAPGTDYLLTLETTECYMKWILKRH